MPKLPEKTKPANVPSYAMAGASEMPLIIYRLHRQDNFKKCAARPFVYNDLLGSYDELKPIPTLSFPHPVYLYCPIEANLAFIPHALYISMTWGLNKLLAYACFLLSLQGGKEYLP